MDSTTYFQDVKIPPKKLRFLLPSIKKNNPVEAMGRLLYMPNRSARLLYQAIQSSVSAAKQAFNIEPDLLKFKALVIEEGHTLKRYSAGARGTMKPYKKRFSHIKIILTADQPKESSKKIELKKSEKGAKEEVEKTVKPKVVEAKVKVKKVAKKKTIKKITKSE